jgi:hypothetical protein
VQPVVPAAPATAPAPVGPRLRDTVWNFKAMLAVALASLLVGGLGGAAIVALADGDDHPERIRIANFGDGPGGRGEFRGPFGDGEKLKEFREWRRDHEFPPLPDRPDATPSPSASPSGSAG